MADKKPRPFTEREERMAAPFVKLMSNLNTWIYRISGGKIWGTWLYGAPVALVTAIGRKSGKPRTVPLLYLWEGENIVLVASKGGMSHHPLWYGNMVANPNVEIQIGAEKTKMTARDASDEEKAALWPKLVKMYPDYDDYQARTERNIPVLILSPR